MRPRRQPRAAQFGLLPRFDGAQGWRFDRVQGGRFAPALSPVERAGEVHGELVAARARCPKLDSSRSPAQIIWRQGVLGADTVNESDKRLRPARLSGKSGEAQKAEMGD